jgi:hypothetical protein
MVNYQSTEVQCSKRETIGPVLYRTEQRFEHFVRWQEVVAACEVVNCQSIEVQCSKRVPTIVLDSAD